VLDKVITQVNKKIASHNRLHFGLESQRHVLEQVDGVYWRDVLARGLPARKAETVVKRDVDFTEAGTESGNNGLGGNVLPENLEDVLLDPRPRKRRRTENTEGQEVDGATDADLGLPSQESHEPAKDADLQDRARTELQAQKYAELNQKLHLQRARRDTLRRKLAQYKKLQSLLAPFEKPQENVQPNLVTKDSKELEEEVTRMRMLLARVGNQIQARQEGYMTVNDYGANGHVVTDTTRLEGVLGLG